MSDNTARTIARCQVKNKNPTLLHDLIANAESVVTSLKGNIGSPERNMIHMEGNNEKHLSLLYCYWRKNYPAATHAYWWVRSWSMLFWQPIYIAMVGVHYTNCLPNLALIAQHKHLGFLVGYTVEPHQPLTGSESCLILNAGKTLKEYIDWIYSVFERVMKVENKKIKRRLAYRLVEDITLSSLQKVLLYKKETREIQEYSLQWLNALSIEGSSELALINKDEQHYLVLNRKACCMHFLRDDGAICASCPKLTWPERIERQIKEINEHA